MILADLSRPLALLRLLVVDHPHLPAPTIRVSPIYPDRLEFCLHDSLGAFEAWRDALGIDPNTVQHNLQSGDTTVVLSASAEIAGAQIGLLGYSPNVLLAVAA